jgi:probable HAF family extracellular repeat protein
VVGSSDTPALNPFARIPGYQSMGCLGNPCHVSHAFEWRNGVMTDLGTLGGYNGGIFELNGAGDGAGISETGVVDPLTRFPEAHAVMSHAGRLIDLGTLGGNESWAMAINDRAQVSGFASNSTRDPYARQLSPYPSATEWRAVIWQHGQAHDLGTLGGPDSLAGFLNARGEAAGESFTNSTPNRANGLPTMDPFLWQGGRMRDLGTLGGTFGITNWLNSQGEVVGSSFLRGDHSQHPFLWNGKRLVDLGTLGGHNGVANWVSDAGAVVGQADLPGFPRSPSYRSYGFLWTNGVMRSLPPAKGDRCAKAFMINAHDQIVGADFDCQTGKNVNAMLWEHGTAYNLNTLVRPTRLHLTEAFFISANGEIACMGTLPNGNTRVAVLTPNR